MHAKTKQGKNLCDYNILERWFEICLPKITEKNK